MRTNVCFWPVAAPRDRQRSANTRLSMCLGNQGRFMSHMNASRHEVCRVGLACQSAANHCSVGKADGRSQLPHDFQIMTHFLNVEVKEASAPPSIITIWRLQMGCLINRVAFGGTHLAHRQCACNRSSGKLPRLEGRKVKTILNDRKNLIKNI